MDSIVGSEDEYGNGIGDREGNLGRITMGVIV